jgi:tyrosyl-tRNA synthetase
MNLDWLTRGTSEIFPEGLEIGDRPLRVKLGIDPTGSEIHLGHTIPFRKLRAFQDAGHLAVLIIGDFTAQIGDPTGKSQVRKQLTPAQVQENAQGYLAQLRPILDFETPGRLEIRYNSEWLSQLDLGKILELLATMTVGQMLAKEGFSERFKQENPIFIHEFLYPLMQGYDSVMINADVELGGTDQKFNIAVGRDLQRHFGKKPQFGLLLPILIGTDGVHKMSKSLHNYVGLQEDALSMYSKLQKTPDALLPTYFELLTKRSPADIPIDPRQAQRELALDIVSQFHGTEGAISVSKAAQEILNTGNTSLAEAVAEYSLIGVNFPVKLFYLLSDSGLCTSSTEGKRQIQGGAVRLDGDRLTDPELSFTNPRDLQGKVLQLGKRKFVRFVI